MVAVMVRSLVVDGSTSVTIVVNAVNRLETEDTAGVKLPPLQPPGHDGDGG